jgi:hypothetical protein
MINSGRVSVTRVLRSQVAMVATLKYSPDGDGDAGGDRGNGLAPAGA